MRITFLDITVTAHSTWHARDAVHSFSSKRNLSLLPRNQRKRPYENWWVWGKVAHFPPFFHPPTSLSFSRHFLAVFALFLKFAAYRVFPRPNGEIDGEAGKDDRLYLRMFLTTEHQTVKRNVNFNIMCSLHSSPPGVVAFLHFFFFFFFEEKGG